MRGRSSGDSVYGRGEMGKRALKMSPIDNVATAIDVIEPGDLVSVTTKDGARVDEVEVLDKVDIYHKFALSGMAAHDIVYKYGEVIGEATQPIKRGEHVHVHNIASVKTRNHD